MPLQVVGLRQAVGSERVPRPLISSYLETVASHQQMQGVGVPANETPPYIAWVVSQIWSQRLSVRYRIRTALIGSYIIHWSTL